MGRLDRGVELIEVVKGEIGPVSRASQAVSAHDSHDTGTRWPRRLHGIATMIQPTDRTRSPRQNPPPGQPRIAGEDRPAFAAESMPDQWLAARRDARDGHDIIRSHWPADMAHLMPCLPAPPDRQHNGRGAREHPFRRRSGGTARHAEQKVVLVSASRTGSPRLYPSRWIGSLSRQGCPARIMAPPQAVGTR